MSRIRNALILIITLSVIVFAFTACDRKGTINENLKPFIEITSYEGVDSAAVAQSGEALLFQQKIYWEAYDLDGTVDKFAFRVGYEDETTGEFRPYTDNAGNLVGVPDYTVIDEDGWVYHYQDGADETMPLELTTQKTIWTDQVYAVINFPANVNGDSTQVVNIFEVKCIDNNKEESDIARKYYKVTSRVPICTISSSKGAIDGEMIGTGIVFTFNIIDNDQFVGNEPDYFEFRLEKRDLLGNLIEGEDGYLDSTVWYSTRGQEDVGQYFVKVGNVNPDYPALLLDNIMNGIAQDSTYLIAKAIDLAGIVSDPDTVSFVVKEGFYPNTLIYDGIDQGEGTPTNTYDIMVLGENHYITQNPVTKIIP
nr:hypothetical protein [Candidatus Cloacimonadota bacterium]